MSLASQPAYRYGCTWLRTLDADTLDLSIALGFYVELRQRIRLAGIDAPELHTDAGKAAKQFTVDWLEVHAPGDQLVVRTERALSYDKYGRWLGWVYSPVEAAEGVTACLNDALVAHGHAVRYPY